MTVRVYKSTDASAPVLNGLAGSLVTVLDAVLVNGYGTMTAAGWAKPFSGTNKAVYRSATANGGSGLYYRVLDDATVTDFNYPYLASSKFCGIVGYESMSSVDTGTNPFSGATSTTTLMIMKSATSDSITRDWVIIADQYTAIILVDYKTDVVNYGYRIKVMGEFFPHTPAFAWKGVNTERTFLMSIDAGNKGGGGNLSIPRKSNNTIMTVAGRVFANFSTIGFPETHSLVRFYEKLICTGGYFADALAALPYPHPTDSKLHLSKLFISSGESAPLGYFRGIFVPLHDKPLQNGDVFHGTGSLSGKTFQLFDVSMYDGGNTQTTTARFAFEISDTWAYSV